MHLTIKRGGLLSSWTYYFRSPEGNFYPKISLCPLKKHAQLYNMYTCFKCIFGLISREVVSGLSSKSLTSGEKSRSHTMSSRYPKKIYELSGLRQDFLRSIEPVERPNSFDTTLHLDWKRKYIFFLVSRRVSKLPCPLLIIRPAFWNSL